MLILHDPHCASYGSAIRPEQPARVTESVAHLRSAHPTWSWQVPTHEVSDSVLLLAHTRSHLERLDEPRDFDGDTPFFPGIAGHARRSVAAALAAAEYAVKQRRPTLSLMRPPGHHATADQAMGFCYLNQIAITALAARARLKLPRVAVWDFDAHHGNGTESILAGELAAGGSGLFFASVHQFPGYPGTGTHDLSPQIRNWPIAPNTPRVRHMDALRESLEAIWEFQPDLILVSAGFDAYARDPITSMTLEQEDFAELGTWLRQSERPAAALLEGGYSPDLPLLIDAFLSAWENGANRP